MTIAIRNACAQDAAAVAAIEALCFPAAEAASAATIAARIAAFPAYFFVAEENGALIGFVNGCVTNSPIIEDELFQDPSRHIPSGTHAAIFGLDVVPKRRRQGVAAQLMRHFISEAQRQGQRHVILTCKKHLIRYYETFGYANNGLSQSIHGGAEWYDMTLDLER
ncbi:GNAT family N-acetyltransferase [uncultured Anaeromusa sp.]|uniref:GNAT family N-acetyltransferase n=1 Tax=uncultured Anaeromusa sp. TaxID=673273 RepID=UPI0029C94B90|nr:GNAT family N-acetyltransferase [uncultured Anaeromusa sp.]